MVKAISKSAVSILKWGTVVAATAAVVITIQANADGHGDHSDKSAAPNSSSVSNGASTRPWAPSAGFADLIERVSPAVVHVATSGLVEQRRRRGGQQFGFPRNFEDFFRDFQNRRGPQQEPEAEEEGEDEPNKLKRPLGIGSGFVISADGYVVTNHHVVDKADEIIISFTNGDEYVAEIKGSDPKTDLALLKLKDAKDLPFVSWGDDDKSRVGDWVLAIGNPFGLGGSASTGIISARGRDIGSGSYDDFIQVDAAINRGNSGGPLFNTNGEVIGINTAIYSPNGGSVGIGFSIPANLAKNVISQLERSGEVERAWIGVQIQALDDELAEGFGRDNDHGALVTAIQPGTPAADANIEAGDIILSFDGQEVEKMRDLPKIVAQSSVGKKYKVDVWRNGARKSLTIKTARFPDDESFASQGSDDEPKAKSEPKMDKVLGAQLEGLDSETRERYNIDELVKGVLVLGVKPGGLAAQNGLRRGDVITTLNGVGVRSADDVFEIVETAQKKGRSNIPVLLQRNGGARFLPFKLEKE